MKKRELIENCPHCNYTLDDGLILDVFKKFRDDKYSLYADKTDIELEKMVIDFYGNLDDRFSQIIQVCNDYRRTYYECPNCKHKIDKPYK